MMSDHNAALHSRTEANARQKPHLDTSAATSTDSTSMTGGAQQPKTVSQWTLPTTKGIQSLVLIPDATLDSPRSDEVRVKLHAASLNYRDLVIARVSNSKIILALGRW